MRSLRLGSKVKKKSAASAAKVQSIAIRHRGKAVNLAPIAFHVSGSPVDLPAGTYFRVVANRGESR